MPATQWPAASQAWRKAQQGRKGTYSLPTPCMWQVRVHGLHDVTAYTFTSSIKKWSLGFPANVRVRRLQLKLPSARRDPNNYRRTPRSCGVQKRELKRRYATSSARERLQLPTDATDLRPPPSPPASPTHQNQRRGAVFREDLVPLHRKARDARRRNLTAAMAHLIQDLVYSLGNCLNCFPGSPTLKVNGRSFKILRLLGEVRGPSAPSHCSFSFFYRPEKRQPNGLFHPPLTSTTPGRLFLRLPRPGHGDVRDACPQEDSLPLRC